MFQVLSGKTGPLRAAYTCSSIRETVGPVRNGAEELVTNGIEKAKVLDAFFALVFTHKTSLQESQVPKTRGRVWSKEY